MAECLCPCCVSQPSRVMLPGYSRCGWGLSEHHSSPHVSSLFGRRHLEVGLKQTAGSDFSSLCLVKAQLPEVAKGWLVPGITPAKPVPLWVSCSLQHCGDRLLKLPPSASQVTAAVKRASQTGKSFSAVTDDHCPSFHWQIPCCFLDGVATTRALDSVNFLPYFWAVFTIPPSKSMVGSSSLSLCQGIAAYMEKGVPLLRPITIFFVVVVASCSSDSFPVTRYFWLRHPLIYLQWQFSLVVLLTPVYPPDTSSHPNFALLDLFLLPIRWWVESIGIGMTPKVLFKCSWFNAWKEELWLTVNGDMGDTGSLAVCLKFSAAFLRHPYLQDKGTCKTSFLLVKISSSAVLRKRVHFILWCFSSGGSGPV